MLPGRENPKTGNMKNLMLAGQNVHMEKSKSKYKFSGLYQLDGRIGAWYILHDSRI
jgi:hypothetical protein